MNYGRLGPSDPDDLHRCSTTTHTANPASSLCTTRKKKLIMLTVLAIVLIVASAVSAVLVIGSQAHVSGQNGPSIHRPSQAISRTCSKTGFPTLCVNSLLQFPGSTAATEDDLIHISFNATLQQLNRALYTTTGISNIQMDPRVRSAYEDCVELLEDSVDALSRSLFSVASSPSNGRVKPSGSADDVMTWLSGALTNQDTCAEGFSDITGTVKDQMTNNLKDLSKLVSNCLAIFSASAGDDFAGVPIQNRRRLMWSENDETLGKFPKWLSGRDRKLLSSPVSAIQADIVVSKDGNGTYKTISEAIKKVPDYSSRRIVIYVRAGR